MTQRLPPAPLPVRVLVSALGATLLCAPAAWAAPEAVLPLTVRAGDTLWRLSNEVLTGPAAWREVARRNRLPDADRIYPGQVLQVPQRLLRAQPVDARLVLVQGDVQLAGRPAVAGEAVSAGQLLRTGSGASAVLELHDGSRLRVQPATDAALAESARLGARPPGVQGGAAGAGDEGWFAGSMRLVRGSLEVVAARLLRAKPLEVQSPTAVIGVRGTEYRVHHGPEQGTRTEVLEGLVRAEASGAPQAGVDVAARFGAAIGDAGSPPTVVVLPPAPDVSGLPPLLERVIVRIELPGEPAALRVQVALDAAFERIVSDERLAAGAPVRLSGLADGDWFVRLRYIESRGIEGLDATHRFTLAARPEPPAPAAPRAGAQVGVGQVEFSWAENVDALYYHLQVARDAAFTDLVIDQPQVRGAATSVTLDQPGAYFWRMASVRAPQGDQRQRGPWTDAQPLTVRAAPPAPTSGSTPDGKQLALRWSGRPQDRQQVELSSDPQFGAPATVRAELDEPRWTLPRPDQPGTYYFRYRSVEPDGFVTPYSSTLKIEVARDWRGLWLLGAPLLLLLL